MASATRDAPIKGGRITAHNENLARALTLFKRGTPSKAYLKQNTAMATSSVSDRMSNALLRIVKPAWMSFTVNATNAATMSIGHVFRGVSNKVDARSALPGQRGQSARGPIANIAPTRAAQYDRMATKHTSITVRQEFTSARFQEEGLGPAFIT